MDSITDSEENKNVSPTNHVDVQNRIRELIAERKAAKTRSLSQNYLTISVADTQNEAQKDIELSPQNLELSNINQSDLHNQIQILQKERIRLIAELKGSVPRKTLVEAEIRCKTLQTQLDSIVDKLAQTQLHLNKKESEIQQLKSENEFLKQQSSTATCIPSSTTAVSNNIQSADSSQNILYVQTNKADICTQTAPMDNQQPSVSVEDLDFEFIQRQLQEKNQTISDLELKITDYELKFQELDLKLEDSGAMIRQTQSKVSELESRHKMSVSKLQESESRLVVNQSRLKIAETQVSITESRLSECINQLALSRIEAAELRNRLADIAPPPPTDATTPPSPPLTTAVAPPRELEDVQSGLGTAEVQQQQQQHQQQREGLKEEGYNSEALGLATALAMASYREQAARSELQIQELQDALQSALQTAQSERDWQRQEVISLSERLSATEKDIIEKDEIILEYNRHLEEVMMELESLRLQHQQDRKLHLQLQQQQQQPGVESTTRSNSTGLTSYETHSLSSLPDDEEEEDVDRSSQLSVSVSGSDYEGSRGGSECGSISRFSDSNSNKNHSHRHHRHHSHTPLRRYSDGRDYGHKRGMKPTTGVRSGRHSSSGSHGHDRSRAREGPGRDRDSEGGKRLLGRGRDEIMELENETDSRASRSSRGHSHSHSNANPHPSYNAEAIAKNSRNSSTSGLGKGRSRWRNKERNTGIQIQHQHQQHQQSSGLDRSSGVGDESEAAWAAQSEAELSGAGLLESERRLLQVESERNMLKVQVTKLKNEIQQLEVEFERMESEHQELECRNIELEDRVEQLEVELNEQEQQQSRSKSSGKGRESRRGVTLSSKGLGRGKPSMVTVGKKVVTSKPASAVSPARSDLSIHNIDISHIGTQTLTSYPPRSSTTDADTDAASSTVAIYKEMRAAVDMLDSQFESLDTMAMRRLTDMEEVLRSQRGRVNFLLEDLSGKIKTEIMKPPSQRSILQCRNCGHNHGKSEIENSSYITVEGDSSPNTLIQSARYEMSELQRQLAHTHALASDLEVQVLEKDSEISELSSLFRRRQVEWSQRESELVNKLSVAVRENEEWKLNITSFRVQSTLQDGGSTQTTGGRGQATVGGEQTVTSPLTMAIVTEEISRLKQQIRDRDSIIKEREAEINRMNGDMEALLVEVKRSEKALKDRDVELQQLRSAEVQQQQMMTVSVNPGNGGDSSTRSISSINPVSPPSLTEPTTSPNNNVNSNHNVNNNSNSGGGGRLSVEDNPSVESLQSVIMNLKQQLLDSRHELHSLKRQVANWKLTDDHRLDSPDSRAVSVSGSVSSSHGNGVDRSGYRGDYAVVSYRTPERKSKSQPRGSVYSNNNNNNNRNDNYDNNNNNNNSRNNINSNNNNYSTNSVLNNSNHGGNRMDGEGGVEGWSPNSDCSSSVTSSNYSTPVRRQHQQQLRAGQFVTTMKPMKPPPQMLAINPNLTNLEQLYRATENLLEQRDDELLRTKRRISALEEELRAVMESNGQSHERQLAMERELEQARRDALDAKRGRKECEQTLSDRARFIDELQLQVEELKMTYIRQEQGYLKRVQELNTLLSGEQERFNLLAEVTKETQKARGELELRCLGLENMVTTLQGKLEETEQRLVILNQELQGRLQQQQQVTNQSTQYYQLTIEDLEAKIRQMALEKQTVISQCEEKIGQSLAAVMKLDTMLNDSEVQLEDTIKQKIAFEHRTAIAEAKIREFEVRMNSQKTQSNNDTSGLENGLLYWKNEAEKWERQCVLERNTKLELESQLQRSLQSTRQYRGSEGNSGGTITSFYLNQDNNNSSNNNNNNNSSTHSNGSIQATVSSSTGSRSTIFENRPQSASAASYHSSQSQQQAPTPTQSYQRPVSASQYAINGTGDRGIGGGPGDRGR